MRKSPVIRSRRRVGLLSALVLFVTTLLTGCSLNPGELASSVRSTGDGVSITVKFANTLNLPEGADVTLNGARVGSVTSVTLVDQHVDVAAKLSDGVRIPADATGSIRQNTVLGDPYLALSAKIGGVHTVMLSANGIIPLDQTDSPPPLEDTLAVVANFINGGSVQNMQDVIRKVNTALPEIKQTQRVAKISAIDLDDLAERTKLLDGMIGGLDKTARTIIPRLGDIELMLAPKGMHYWSQLSKLFSGIGIVLPSIGSVFEGGYWLMPLLRNVDASVHTGRDVFDGIAENKEMLQKFLAEKLFPFMRKPGLEIVSAKSADGREIIGNATQVLRMLGAVR